MLVAKGTPVLSGAFAVIAPYFDVHLFRDIFLPDGMYYSQLARVQHMIKNNRIRVFGSAKQLEELFGLAPWKPSEYNRMSFGALALTGNRFLRDRRQLCYLELTRRKSLPTSDACVDRSILEQIHKLCDAAQPRSEVRAKVEEQHESFRATFEELGKNLMERFAAMGVSRSDLQRDVSKDWKVTRAEVDDWIYSTSQLRERYKFESVEAITTWQMPVLRSWFAYSIAHAKDKAVTGRAITPSDKGDWEHYAYAAVGGLFVTNDGNLRRIASRIELRHVRVVTGDEFFRATINQ